MDSFGFTEADFPVRSKTCHLLDVVFQCIWEGPDSAITQMYEDAASRAGATRSEIDSARRAGRAVGYQPELTFKQAVARAECAFSQQSQSLH